VGHQIKILFLCPYPYDEVASQRFRFEQYFETLRKNNIQLRQKSFYSRWAYKVLYRKKQFILKAAGTIFGFLKRIFHFFYCISFDYIFIHREVTPIGPPVFEWLMAKVLGKKIIYDFDDAIWMPNTSDENSLISGLKWHKKFNSICAWSYKISCCNEFLAEQAGKFNHNIIIIPTTIDTLRFEIGKTLHRYGDHVVIGWTGTHSTLSYLSPMIDLLKKIIEMHQEVQFRIICNKTPDWELPNLQFIEWNKSNEVRDLIGIDIGIMPLPDTDWAMGKCGFKILQYLALEIPAIATPVGVNKEIIVHGKNGFLCTSEKEWLDHLKLLIESKELRQELGKNGRKTVEEYYSLEVNNKSFLDLFE
jgi:glycosyltransferase involved in cell wall biosynthesis